MQRRKSKSGSAMYTFWAMAIILCLLLVLVSLFASSCGRTENLTRTNPTNAPSDQLQTSAGAVEGTAQEPGGMGQETAGGAQPETGTGTEVPVETVAAPPAYLLGETADAGQEYIDKLTFVGDSTTYGLKAYSMLSGGKETTQVWTPLSGTLTLCYWDTASIFYPEKGVEVLLVEAVEMKMPEYLVITLGVNGVSFMDETAFKQSYTAMVNAIKAASPDTKIICNSIYPVEASYEAKNNGINNAKITAANGWIQQVAESTGTKYSATDSVLKDASGCMDPQYGNGDGIHLFNSGFELVLNYLRTHAYN